jgi:hypothetical protein
MTVEPFEEDVDAKTIEVVDAAIKALGLPTQKITLTLVWLVGYTCGQSAWPLSKILEWATPMLNEGRRRGEEVRARLAREQGRPSS